MFTLCAGDCFINSSQLELRFNRYQGGSFWGAFGVFLQRPSILGRIAWPNSEDCDAG